MNQRFGPFFLRTGARILRATPRAQVDGQKWNQPTDTVKTYHFTKIWPPFFLQRFFNSENELISAFTLKSFETQVVSDFTLNISKYIVSKLPEATSNRSLSWHLDLPWSWWSCTVSHGSCHTLGDTCGIYSYLTITQPSRSVMPGGVGRWRCESGHFWSCPSGEKCFRCLWSAIATRTGYIYIYMHIYIWIIIELWMCQKKKLNGMVDIRSSCNRIEHLAILFCATLTWDEYARVHHEIVP